MRLGFNGILGIDFMLESDILIDFKKLIVR